MKKQELLKIIDYDLLDHLFGFCYARTNDSYEAQELCSDIIFALAKAANSEGEIENPYPFIWKIARNVYADFLEKRRRHADMFYEGDSYELFPYIADVEEEDHSGELLEAVYRRIAFLTKAYREVMIMFYIDGLSTAEIAVRQKISEVAVRQRLFSARKRIRSEVKEMTETYNKPVALDKIDYVIWGNGNPGWSDPRNVCTRQFSKHTLYLCYKKPMSAAEIAEKLNVPTVYVEEELDILEKGENGKYGFLRKVNNGKYAINFILLDKETMEKANAIYTEQISDICDIICDFIEKNKEEYLAFPYLNRKIDWNLVLWQQIVVMAHAFVSNVEKVLNESYFAQVEKSDRPFHVFGYIDNGKYYGGGWDGVNAENVCGYSKIRVDNIYLTRIKEHFHCGLNIASDIPIQLALRAVEGLDINTLSEVEKEHAAKAIACGYLYREGEMLYTKILVNQLRDSEKIYAISRRLEKGYFEEKAQVVAEKVAQLIHESVPDYLLSEWIFANTLAALPVTDSVVEVLIEKGILVPPEDGIGAEGCWMGVEKNEGR